MPTAAAASGLAGFWRLPAARRRGMSTEGAAAGLELVFPLLGHPPSVGFWGGGRRERSDAPCLRPQPQQRLASGPSPAVRPPLPPLPSLVQAGVAAWAQLAPVSGPPLVPLTLPDGGRVEGTLRSQPPLSHGVGPRTSPWLPAWPQSTATSQLCSQASEKVRDEHGLSVPLRRLSPSSRGSGPEEGEEGDRVFPTGRSA